MKKSAAALLLFTIVISLFFSTAMAYQSTTLRSGMKGDEVRKLQQALIDQGYLSGTADGIFGTHTENAVRAFQKKHNLKADGLAGLKTQELLYQNSSAASSGTPAASDASGSAGSPATSGSSAPSGSSSSSGSSGSSGSSRSASLRAGDKGEQVRSLQESLIKLNYLSGSADGKYGNQTKKAVIKFQKKNGLHADGIAGAKTMAAIAEALKTKENASASSAAASGSSSTEGTKISAPSKSEIKLLHWFDDIKPSLKSKQTILIYDPSTGYAWYLRVLSRGRHLDAEPLTLQDTQTMLKAFGGKNTWNQKGVYVRLPGGTWTVGATHDMPHETGSIKDNGFDGHLCVHFLRNMEECEQNDPNYGVSNQRTIRELWRNLTGETIDY